MKMNKIIMVAALSMALASVNANAETATGTLTPSITIFNACVVAVNTDTDFPVTLVSKASTLVTGTIGTISVKDCLGGTYRLGASAGGFYASSNRHLGSAGGMVYTLDLSSTDAGSVTNWGDNGVAGTALTTTTTVATQSALLRTGASNLDNYTITGNVTTLATPVAGTYSDSLTITAEF